MIKKMIGTLISEFHEAVENGNKQRANTMRDLTEKIHTKLVPDNTLWAGKVNKVLTDMARKLNK